MASFLAARLSRVLGGGLLCAALLLAGPGVRAADLDEILKRGKLIVSMHQEEAPPFFMHDKKGVLYGYDVELAQNIADRLGVRLELNRTATSYDEVVRIAQEGKADVAISALSDTLERATYITFTHPYLSIRKALLVNRLEVAHRHAGDNPMEYLNHPDVKIAVAAGSSYVAFAAFSFPQAVAVPYVDWNTAGTDIEQGKILAAFYDEFEVQDWLSKHPEASIYLQTVLLPDNVDTLAFAVNTKDTQLLNWLNLYLEKIKANGTTERLVQYYLKSSAWKNR